MVKYNSSGTRQWARMHGSTNDDRSYGVATDSSGNVYISGYTHDQRSGSGTRDIFVVKYNSSVTKQWARELGSTGHEDGKGVATDSSGNVYVTGYTDGGLDSNSNLGCDDF